MPYRRRFGWVRIYMARRFRCSQCSSDTYDVYYDNPGLIPQVHWPPVEVSETTPRTLDKDRGDSTVGDIRNFIVEYINSDVMVCLRLCPVLVPLSSFPLRSAGPPGGPEHCNSRSNKGGTLFVYDLLRLHPLMRWCIRRSVHEARHAVVRQ